MAFLAGVLCERKIRKGGQQNESSRGGQGRRDEPGDDVVLVVRVASELSKFLGVRELDVDTVLLHDALQARTEGR
jgi:hypothetical protein